MSFNRSYISFLFNWQWNLLKWMYRRKRRNFVLWKKWWLGFRLAWNFAMKSMRWSVFLINLDYVFDCFGQTNWNAQLQAGQYSDHNLVVCGVHLLIENDTDFGVSNSAARRCRWNPPLPHLCWEKHQRQQWKFIQFVNCREM